MAFPIRLGYSLRPVYVVANLPRGIHLIELSDTVGIPFAIGRVRSHASEEYEVDDLGRIHRETDALGHMTVNVVDVLGRKIKVTRGPAANQSVVDSAYDPGGRLILERAEWRDETGQNRPEVAVVKRYRYDQAGRLLSASVGPEQGGTKRIIRHRYDSRTIFARRSIPAGAARTLTTTSLTDKSEQFEQPVLPTIRLRPHRMTSPVMCCCNETLGRTLL